MKCMPSRWTARIELLVAVVLAAAPATSASAKPQYGGTLRVEVRAAALDLDPRHWKPGTEEFALNEHFASLLFDRLVALDNYGRFQPRLATEWSHDASFRRWQFTLRSGVKLSDGTLLTPGDVASSLQSVLPSTIRITPFSGSVLFQSSTPIPDLLEQLASGRCFVFREAADGTLLGTGAFAQTFGETDRPPANSPDAARTSTKLRFHAQEQSWSGRPFVDHVEVTLGVLPLRALFDLQMGKADIILLAPEVVRRALQSGVRMWASDPVTLYLLLLDPASSPASDQRLREAFALSLDRGTMAGVLLQKQADPAASLLPQWLSGYALFFDMDMNLERARELQQALPHPAANAAKPLRLRIDAPGELPRLVAERVAVNARQAGILVQTAGHSAEADTTGATSVNGKLALHLVTWRYTSLSPHAELESMIRSLHLESNADLRKAPGDLEQLHDAEQMLLETHEALPLVAFPDYVALSAAVRDWMPNSWGEWHLADVWLDRSTKSPSLSTASPGAAASPGVRP
jgi:ABC-type transport system substrate-binding protein